MTRSKIFAGFTLAVAVVVVGALVIYLQTLWLKYLTTGDSVAETDFRPIATPQITPPPSNPTFADKQARIEALADVEYAEYDDAGNPLESQPVTVADKQARIEALADVEYAEYDDAGNPLPALNPDTLQESSL